MDMESVNKTGTKWHQTEEEKMLLICTKRRVKPCKQSMLSNWSFTKAYPLPLEKKSSFFSFVMFDLQYIAEKGRRIDRLVWSREDLEQNQLRLVFAWMGNEPLALSFCVAHWFRDTKTQTFIAAACRYLKGQFNIIGQITASLFKAYWRCTKKNSFSRFYSDWTK